MCYDCRPASEMRSNYNSPWGTTDKSLTHVDFHFQRVKQESLKLWSVIKCNRNFKMSSARRSLSLDALIWGTEEWRKWKWSFRPRNFVVSRRPTMQWLKISDMIIRHVASSKTKIISILNEIWVAQEYLPHPRIVIELLSLHFKYMEGIVGMNLFKYQVIRQNREGCF